MKPLHFFKKKCIAAFCLTFYIKPFMTSASTDIENE